MSLRHPPPERADPIIRRSASRHPRAPHSFQPDKRGFEAYRDAVSGDLRYLTFCGNLVLLQDDYHPRRSHPGEPDGRSRRAPLKGNGTSHVQIDMA